MVSLKSVMLLVLALLFFAVGGYLLYSSSKERRSGGIRESAAPQILRDTASKSPDTSPHSP